MDGIFESIEKVHNLGEYMFSFLEGIAIVFLLLQFCYNVYIFKLRIDVYWCAYYVFTLMFVLPELIFVINGELELKNYGYQFIKNNIIVDIIFLIYIIFVSQVLKRKAIKNIKCKARSVSLKFNNEKRFSHNVIMLSYFLSLLPTLAALISPQPKLYFASFLPFYRGEDYSIGAEALRWHNGYMTSIVLPVAFVGLIIILLDSFNYKKQTNCFLVKFYVIVVALQILLFSNKRTFGIMVIFVLMLIEVLCNKKTPWLKIFFVGAFCICYFMLYQKITNKTVGGGFSSGVELYSVYFSRVLDMKLVIFSLLNPAQLSILDYPGQSLLHDILFFVPRSVWDSKPWGFGVYYTAAWNGQSVDNVTSKYLTSFFAEFAANFSWFGLFLGVWAYTKLLDCLSKFKNQIVVIFSLYVSIYLMITQIDSNYKNIFILIALVIVLEHKSPNTIKCNMKSTKEVINKI